MPETLPPVPAENAYWVRPGRLLAGEYPAGPSEESARARLRKLLDAGFDCFIDLTQPGELEPYDRWLPGPYGRDAVSYLRKPIRDHGLPADAGQMTEILDDIDAALDEGRRIYLHCRAGIGRTNLVIGCWLARHEGDAARALARLNELWRANPRSRDWPEVPETEAQVEYVRAWREAYPRGAADSVVAQSLQDRYRGLLAGLAVGDALGQATVNRRPGTFTPFGDLVGGGPFDLPRGAWSDETAMALCLAESLVETGAVDPADQAERYRWWQRDGHLSSTGQCLGISAATARALAQAQWSGSPFAGSHDPARADKEPLARIGPAVALHLSDPVEAIEAAVDSARVTHQAPVTLDAVRYFAALLVGALQGAGKGELTRPMFSPVDGLWTRYRLKPEVAAVAGGGWLEKTPPRIFGGGQAPEALEAVLWAFQRTGTFREGAVAAINLGGDADATGSIYGQLGGAHFGASGIPSGWRDALARRELVVTLADGLLKRALRRIAGS